MVCITLSFFSPEFLQLRAQKVEFSTAVLEAVCNVCLSFPPFFLGEKTLLFRFSLVLCAT